MTEGNLERTGRRLMVVLAHPDDEVFTCGGVIALSAARGTQVTLVVATAGERGEIVNPEMRAAVSLDDLVEVRRQELACSIDTLGIRDVVHLGYRDSGMAGTSSSLEPDAFAQQDRERVVRHLVRIIRARRPHVVCTEPENGGYGHPDHIMVHLCTVLAFQRAGDPEWYPDEGVPWQPLKLYFGTFASDMVSRLRAGFAAHGLEPTMGVGIDEMEESNARGTPAAGITTVVDISTTLETKVRAMRCYRTQILPQFFYFTAPHDVLADVLGREYFVLGDSRVETKLPEADLFAGVAL